MNSAQSFDPNGPGHKEKLFGLPHIPETAGIVIVPVPWEVTVSYHTGCSRGPKAVLEASTQVEVFHRRIPDAWKVGIAMTTHPTNLELESARLRELAQLQVERYENHKAVDANDPILAKVNEACENLNIYVKSTVGKWLSQGKLVGIVGGDHSVPLGFIRCLADQHSEFGILQFDAHADLRKAYQGFTYSHASVMYNALKIGNVKKLVQVGLRDICEEEAVLIKSSNGRIVSFFDEDFKAESYKGVSWGAICDRIIAALPDKIYISFDIDGLDPKLCPGTGTPVAGGLEFNQVVYLLERLAKSGKKIIGFDLNEVTPSSSSDWDANVGARLLYQLCIWTAVSQGKLKAS